MKIAALSPKLALFSGCAGCFDQSFVHKSCGLGMG